MKASIDNWKMPEPIIGDSVEIIFKDGRRINVFEDRIEAVYAEGEEIITPIDSLFKERVI